MRRTSMVVGLMLLASVARAQSAVADTSWHGWLYAALGPGAANGESRLAGDLGAWFTHGHRAIGVRMASASRGFDPGDMGDVSVLVGIHPHSDRHTDVVAAAGLGVSNGHDGAGGNLQRRPAIALGAQANLNYVAAGIGLDAFASLAEGRGVWGVGVAVALGVFR